MIVICLCNEFGTSEAVLRATGAWDEDRGVVDSDRNGLLWDGRSEPERACSGPKRRWRNGVSKESAVLWD